MANVHLKVTSTVGKETCMCEKNLFCAKHPQASKKKPTQEYKIFSRLKLSKRKVNFSEVVNSKKNPLYTLTRREFPHKRQLRQSSLY